MGKKMATLRKPGKFCGVERKKKYLPRAVFEEEADRVCDNRVLSWTNPVKTMFMGLALPPNLDHGFDGKVTIKRFSRSKQVQQDKN